MSDNAIVVRPDGEVVERDRPLEVTEVVAMVGRVHGILKGVMKKGDGKGSGGDYDTIPGCGKKPVLLKPGAEKLSMAFGLLPRLSIELRELGGGHREYTVTCNLEGRDGGFRGQGIGSCSTLESKYRYRNAADYEILDTPIPKDSKERRAEYRKQGFGMKQVDGEWYWVKYTTTGKVENPDIADVYNTCLKMAKKRALIDAVITATAAGDIFTQDIDDNPAAFREDDREDTRPPIPDPVETPPPPADGVERITPEQARELWRVAKGHGFTQEQFRAKLEGKGLASTNDLPASDFAVALRWAKGEQGPEDRW